MQLKNGTYLPKPIDYEDMDAEFIKFIDEEIDFHDKWRKSTGSIFNSTKMV